MRGSSTSPLCQMVKRKQWLDEMLPMVKKWWFAERKEPTDMAAEVPTWLEGEVIDLPRPELESKK
jgi:hypothetical protein